LLVSAVFVAMCLGIRLAEDLFYPQSIVPEEKHSRIKTLGPSR
jgi:hypothetical protein